MNTPMSERELQVRQQAIKLAQDLGSFVNSFQNNGEVFATEIMKEHRTLQQSIASLFFTTIKKWAECECSDRYDARNEQTVKICKLIDDFMSEGQWPNWNNLSCI